MQEAKRLVDAGLPIPAYGQLLKLSHAFNILDARGAVGVTERATCFAAMRSLARQIAGELISTAYYWSLRLRPQSNSPEYHFACGQVDMRIFPAWFAAMRSLARQIAGELIPIALC